MKKLMIIIVVIGVFFIHTTSSKSATLTGKVIEKSNKNKSLTVPQNNMIQWFKWLNDKGKIKRKCEKGKAKAIKDILIHIGWLECLDPDYCMIKHVAMRYAFTPKFPKYQRFIQAVGTDTVARIKTDTKQEAG